MVQEFKLQLITEGPQQRLQLVGFPPDKLFCLGILELAKHVIAGSTPVEPPRIVPALVVPQNGGSKVGV